MSLMNMFSASVLTHASNCPMECDTKTVTCSESNFLIIESGVDNFVGALLSRGSLLLPINVVPQRSDTFDVQVTVHRDKFL